MQAAIAKQDKKLVELQGLAAAALAEAEVSSRSALAPLQQLAWPNNPHSNMPKRHSVVAIKPLVR